MAMTRYDAYIEKNWEVLGLAQLLVAKIREDGSADYAVFLIDLFCLGVKDAFFEANVSAAALDDFVNERLTEDMRERLHPACAKKLIEGALAYAEALGFTPHRDFRKARKILSGIDPAVCPRDFTYGRDGRPCYVRGSDDSEERVDRICTILAARCGEDGFDYEDPGEDEEDEALELREELLEWLDAEPPEVPRLYEVSGLITAMLICPTGLPPLNIMDALWGEEGRVWADKEELQDFSDLLMGYWNMLNTLVLDALAPNAAPGTQIFDIFEEDFDEKQGGMEMAAATYAWATGFRQAIELWPADWGDALTRPELVPHWEVVGWWAGFELPENRDLIIAHAKATPPRRLNDSVIALARALRPLGPG